MGSGSLSYSNCNLFYEKEVVDCSVAELVKKEIFFLGFSSKERMLRDADTLAHTKLAGL